MFTNKLDNLDKMKKLSESHKLPKLSQEEIEMMNKPITSKRYWLVILKTTSQYYSVLPEANFDICPNLGES